MSSGPWTIYARQLFPLSYGHPLWGPEPCLTFGEVQLGDVGFLKDGHFSLLFNAIQSADHPVNSLRGVPEGFRVLDVPEHMIKRRPNEITQPLLHSKSLQAVSIAAGASISASSAGASSASSYSCMSEEGALLMLKKPAHRTYMNCDIRIRRYIRDHISSWCTFANEKLEIGLEEKDIIFVSGYTKTSVWAEAAFNHSSSSGELVITGGVPSASGEFRVSMSRGVDASVFSRTGPLDRASIWEQDPRSALLEACDSDQCIFLNYYKMKSRAWWRSTVMRAAAGDHVFPYDGNDDGTSGANLRGCSDEHDEVEKSYDPVDGLLDYILKRSPDIVFPQFPSHDIRNLRKNFLDPFPFAGLEDDEFLDLITRTPDGSEFSFSELESLPSVVSLSSLSTNPEPPLVTPEPVTPSLDTSRPSSFTSPTSTSSSSSSSSSYSSPLPFPCHTRMPTADAVITAVPKMPPNFGEGRITPANVNLWVHLFRQYCRERNVPPDEMVFKASCGFTNLLLREWYADYSDRFDKLAFEDFEEELRARFLSPNWAGEIRDQIVGTKMKPNDSFEDFVLELERLNAHLRGAAHRFSDDALRMFIRANVCPDLRAMINKDDIENIASYVAWKAAATAIDRERSRQIKMFKDLLVTNDNPAGRRARTHYNAGPSMADPVDKLLALSPDERYILSHHAGCFKCRKINVYDKIKHHANNCPNGAPNPATYVPLTTLYPHLVPSKENVRPRPARAAAAVASNDAGDEDGPGAAPVASVNATHSPPAYTTGIIERDSLDESSYVAPFFARQTFLRARASPYPDSPLYDMLIDGGAGPVLIRRDVAIAMGVS